MSDTDMMGENLLDKSNRLSATYQCLAGLFGGIKSES